MKTGCIRYGYDAALMILSHLTINSMKQFVLFVTTKQSTFNFFRPRSRGRKIFSSLVSLANTSPPISIFVILTLRLLQIQYASALGCSVIPDCVVDSQMYVVVSCVYQEE